MVEPQGRQEQALVLEEEDPALHHPGCGHQPVSSLETPALTLHLLVSPTPCDTDHPSLV